MWACAHAHIHIHTIESFLLYFLVCNFHFHVTVYGGYLSMLVRMILSHSLFFLLCVCLYIQHKTCHFNHFKNLFIYFEVGRRAERETERENPKQPLLPVQSLMRGLISQTVRSWRELESPVGRLTDWHIQAPLTMFKYAIWRINYIRSIVQPSTTINSQNFSTLQTETLYPLSNNSLSSATMTPANL